ncbi:hypothetical protein J8N05_09090 [Streptomyces sp. BH-SS-21]|uniref:Uncharacterized protein n=1 Tax=Streptomyces liliiviolaceus TaxID=2823109 RepID=A0A941B5L5_9ACTN|nr:hypothetical protein [Streptomyces liliiviolaceus]MBQ0848366.1 hypothetical protein [Streptomyces liliiviolaceus]
MPDAIEWDSPPKDYGLIVPDGWFKIRLEPELRDQGIVALADQQFRGVDNAPHVKERVMRDLQKQAKTAFRRGGIELYISTLTVGDVPLASSLLVSICPPDSWPRNATVHQLAEYLEAPAKHVALVDLPVAGKAARERYREDPDPEVQMGNTLPTTTVAFHIPIPATRNVLSMTFSTPVDPLADQMVELFDAVAETLHWI